jgi:hypothetical protein
MMDWLVDDRGKRVAPQRLWLSEHLADGLNLVHRYQVRQSKSGSVNVVLMPRGEIAADTLRGLEASYRRLLGAGTPIEVGLTDRLENEASGKFRTIVADDEELAARPRS